MSNYYRSFTLICLWITISFSPVWAQDDSTPLLTRIKMVTIGAPNLDAIEAAYVTDLQYQLRERDVVTLNMAKSWGTPAMAGKPFILMSPEEFPDVYIRAVKTDPVPDYKPMTTFGWNAFEFVIDDVTASYQKLQDSNFTIIGGPNPLKSVPTIHTMQVSGPANEILYLADETIDGPDARLPATNDLFGRPFIVILAGPDITETREWYADNFNMARNNIRQSGGAVVPHALGLPEGSSLPITLLHLSEFGNRIQLDGYDKGSPTHRKRAAGQLPPGNAMVTFSVDTLDNLNLNYISPPQALDGVAYSGLRAATVIGPAGELLELIEEPRN